MSCKPAVLWQNEVSFIAEVRRGEDMVYKKELWDEAKSEYAWHRLIMWNISFLPSDEEH